MDAGGLLLVLGDLLGTTVAVVAGGGSCWVGCTRAGSTRTGSDWATAIGGGDDDVVVDAAGLDPGVIINWMLSVSSRTIGALGGAALGTSGGLTFLSFFEE